MANNRRIQLIIATVSMIALALYTRASDETPGTVADVLSAIRNKTVGSVYDVTGSVVVPPSEDASYFAIEDHTGSVAIRLDLNWPAEKLRIGDNVRVRCEIAETASIPVAAFYQSSIIISRSPRRIKSSNMFVRTEKGESVSVVNLPTFLTPNRIFSAIGATILAVLAIFVWNTSLRRVIERKSHALLKEQLRHVKAELKTEERTRLAVELHDSVAQNLTGVALEIDTAMRTADTDPAAMHGHLSNAVQALKSCREELRNCLWDLRHRALEEKTMDSAIRQTLAPHLDNARLAVRFSAPRDHISDNTAHAILRIIRELTLNAIRHGGATEIRVAGSVENGQLKFSVKDNGRGFNPENAPGFAEGHYGLMGIRERVDEFEGDFELQSEADKGTKATITLNFPTESGSRNAQN